MTGHDQYEPRARRRPETSSEAAASVLPVVSRLRLRVLEHVRGCGEHGATDDEGETALGLKPQTYTPRRGELAALGLVIDSGSRRRTSSGRRAVVWCAPEHALPATAGGATAVDSASDTTEVRP